MRLFISYAHVDRKPYIDNLIPVLREAKHDPWFDGGLLPGPKWKDQLREQIWCCDVFIYALTNESIDSEWCRWEFNRACEFGKRFLPIRLRTNVKIPPQISGYQYADFTDGATSSFGIKLMQGLEVAPILSINDMLAVSDDPEGIPAHFYDSFQSQTLNESYSCYQFNNAETDKSPFNNIVNGNASTIRVVAGPGTGKTYSMMKRVERLLKSDVDPKRILLVTFTRTAARELESELEKLKAPGVSQVNKGTLHSFCFSILHKHHYFAQTGRVPRPLLDFEERFLLEDLKTVGEFGDYYERRKKLKAFEAAWAREHHQEPGAPVDDVDRSFHSALIRWLRFHESMLLSEIVPETLKFLRTNPASEEHNQYDHVLVDEYQDLNRAEQNLVDLLSGNSSLVVIGDANQSIYENFRYAHPEGIKGFGETYKHRLPHDIH